MSYGKLSPAQAQALRPFVKGRVVHDVGAGQCELSLQLLELGASRVVALDKERMPRIDHPRLNQARATLADAVSTESVEGRFGQEGVEKARELVREIDVAFLSWPANYQIPGLLSLVRRARTVVYLGKNTDGSACGWPDLFKLELLHRRVLAHVPEKPNTLIVYGGRVKQQRAPLGEELAAIVAYDVPPRFVTFEEAQAYDRK